MTCSAPDNPTLKCSDCGVYFHYWTGNCADCNTALRARIEVLERQRECLARLLQVTGLERFRGRRDIPSHVVSMAIDVMDQIAQEKQEAKA